MKVCCLGGTNETGAGERLNVVSNFLLPPSNFGAQFTRIEHLKEVWDSLQILMLMVLELSARVVLKQFVHNLINQSLMAVSPSKYK